MLYFSKEYVYLFFSTAFQVKVKFKIVAGFTLFNKGLDFYNWQSLGKIREKDIISF